MMAAIYTNFLQGYHPYEIRVLVASVTAWVVLYAIARTLAEERWRSPGEKAAHASAPTVNGATSSSRSGASAGKDAQRDRLRARAWLLSLMVSALMSTFGLLYAAMLLQEGISGGWLAAARFAMGKDGPFARELCLAFVAFCVTELFVGVLDYRPFLRIDTGYIHHVAYILLCSLMLSQDFPNALTAFGVCEIPTFMLALGSVAPAMRTDLPFGIVFAATRVGYFAIMVVLMFSAGYVLQPAIGTAILALHCVWMRDWARSYARTAAKRAAASTAVHPSGKASSSPRQEELPTPSESVSHHVLRGAATGMASPIPGGDALDGGLTSPNPGSAVRSPDPEAGGRVRSRTLPSLGELVTGEVHKID